MIQDTYSALTRISDLDTQRHVTSRTYENFCWSARLQLLEKQGYPLARLLSERILLQPVRSYVRFMREQHPGAALEVRTLVEQKKDLLSWTQEIYSPGGEKAVVLVTETRTLLGNKPVSLALKSDGSSMESGSALLTDIAPFSGGCGQVKSDFGGLFSERTIFYDFAPSAYWRILEEGRWAFSEKIKLTEERIREIDTVTFFTAAWMTFHLPMRPGRKYVCQTWVDSVEKIRLFMRHDVMDKKTGELVLSARDEQLIVSLEKRRPKKAPVQFLKIIGRYLEKKPVSDE